jgi:hypothetical protein
VRFLRRLADIGWHVHLHIDGQRLPQVLPALLAAPVNLIVDHFGRPDPALGARSEGFQALLRAFDTGRTFVKLSGGFRIGYDPAPLAARLLEIGLEDDVVQFATFGEVDPVVGEACARSDAQRSVVFRHYRPPPSLDGLLRSRAKSSRPIAKGTNVA